MKKKMKKFLFAWAFVLCLILPTEVLLAEESTTEGQVVQKLDSGAIAVQFTEISDYRNDKKEYEDKNGTTYEYYTKTPDAPEGYAGWLFAGWYTDNACEKESALGNSVTSDAAWAKFVPADILSVKAQISAGTFYDSPDAYIRFVTTVDSLNYARVGFDFIIEGEERLGRDSKTVYEFLYAIGNTGKKLNYTPGNIFHSMSQYFVIHTFSGLPNEAFGHGLQVTPYWVTLDGTKVSGEQDIKSVNQGYTSWIKNVTTQKEKSFNNGAGIYSQGGCTDGSFYYQAVIKINDENDENLNTVTIKKYDMKTYEEVDSLISNSLNHANDMTYNKGLTYNGDDVKSGLLVIAHNGGKNDPVSTKNRISFMDPDTLDIVNPKNIIGIEQMKSSATFYDEYITIDTDVYAIDYNATREQYVIGIANVYQFSIYDANFNKVSGPYSHSTEVKEGEYTKQGVGSDDGYIYFIYYNKNKIEVFDWSGQFVTLITTDIKEPSIIEPKTEPENIFIYNNEIYITCGKNALLGLGNNDTELYKVSSVVKPDNEAMIQDSEDSEITYYYPTLELALLEAQEGDTITIIKDNITVNSPMEVTADNVTITNQSDKDVTITRGSSLTDNVFENRAKNFVIKSSGEHTLTVDGASVKGKSIIYNESDASVELDKITIQNFIGINNDENDEGVSALSNRGTMRLQESTFTNNSARTGGVLYSYSGNIVIENCSMTKNQSTYSGGAIRTNSDVDTNLTVKNSTFDGNTANNGNGGAINFCGGEITVIDTTFQNNQIIKGTGGGALVINQGSKGVVKATETYEGPGFYNNSGTCGGAIYTNQSEVHIEGYTFDSNKAIGDIGRGGALLVWKNANTSVDNVTFTNNTAKTGQAIHHQALTFRIHNSHFDTSDAAGYMISQDSERAATLKLSDTTFDTNGKIHLGANKGATVELSGLLTDATIVYGDSVGQNVTIGSNTLDKASTVTLQPSSSYYNDGTSVLTKGSNVNDERLANAVAVVKLADNPTDVTGEWHISDDGKMVEGLGGYTVGTGGDYETLSAALSADDVTSGTTLYVLNDLTVNDTLAINKNIVLKNHPNNAANGVTISRGTTNAMFDIASGYKLSVRGIITLDGNKANYTGTNSLIVNEGTLSMGQNVTIQNAKSSTSGGAITTYGELVLEGTSFINNDSTQSSGYGGAIYLDGGSISSLEGCTFTGNTAHNGGAIGAPKAKSSAKITNGIKNSKFYDNKATNYRGGAIYYAVNNTTNTLVIDSCEFIGNEVTKTSGNAAGGAIWTNRTMEIKGNGVFEENSSSNYGGAIYATDPYTYSITGQTFENNSAVDDGSALYYNNTYDHGTITITDSNFISAEDAKSPVYAKNTTALSNVTFSGGNKEVVLPEAASKAIISGKITDAVFVYKNAEALVTVASTGIDATSTLSLTPMKYKDGETVLGSEDESAAAKEALDNAAKIIEVTQEATQSGAKWWTITSEGKLNCSAIVSSDPAVADFTSLEAAISEMPTGAVIYVNANETIANTITIDKAITLKTSTEGVTLTRGNAAEMFNVTSNGSLTVEGAITLDGNKTDYNDANSLIVNEGTLELGKGVVVKNASYPSGNGGAVYSTGTLAVTDAAFQDNTAKAGGAVYINGGTASFEGTANSQSAIFSGNIASGTALSNGTSGDCVDGGGAIYVQRGKVTSIDGYTFEENQGQDGGAIVVSEYEITTQTDGAIESLKNCYFNKNQAIKSNGYGGRGGAIYHRGLSTVILEIENCTFVNNTAKNAYGGAIWANRPFEIKGEGLFESNSTSYGGAIYVTSGNTYSITGQTFKNNSSAYIGGAICFNNANSKGIINASEFINNSAVDNGGAIYSIGKLDVSDTEFDQNTAKAGGAVYINGGTASFEGTANSETAIFSGNIASGKEFDGSNCKDGGGAIYVQSGTVTLIDGYTFEENKGQDGGAIVVNPSGAIQSLKNSYFDKNQAIKNGSKGGRGGAIYNRGLTSVTLEIESCTFVNNTANNSYGGAIWVNRNLVIKGEGLFENNSASNGGAIYATDPYKYSITGQTFKNNYSKWDAGAIYFYNEGSTDIIKDSHFVNNVAENYGGAIYNKGTVTMDALSTFTGNQSKAGGDNVTSDGTTKIAGLYNAGTFTFNTETE